MNLRPQLNFGGNCEEAFRFYERHLGGKVTMMLDQGSLPNAPKGGGKAIIHARITIGDSELVGNDVPAQSFKRITSAYLNLTVDSVQEAERLYALLAEGGEVYIPLEENFFATRFSQLRDRFGVSWSIVHERTRQPV